MQHLGQFDADQPAADDDRALCPLHVLIQLPQVFQVVQSLHALEILSGPAKLVRLGAGGDKQSVVGQPPATMQHQLLVVDIDTGDTVPYQVKPLVAPEAVLEGLRRLVGHVPHEYVHQGGAGIVVGRFTRYQRDLPVRLELPEPCGGRYTGYAVPNDHRMQWSTS